MSTERPRLQLGPSPQVTAASAAGARCAGRALPAPGFAREAPR